MAQYDDAEQRVPAGDIVWVSLVQASLVADSCDSSVFHGIQRNEAAIRSAIRRSSGQR